MKLLLIRIITLIIFFCFFKANAQRFKNDTFCNNYLSFQSGFTFDFYNSLGARLQVEYYKKIKRKQKKYIGFFLDNKVHLTYAATDNYGYPQLNTIFVGVNYHYMVNLWKNRLLWDIGAGTGCMSVFNKTTLSFLPTFNLHATLDFKISKKCFLQLPPLLVFLPFNKASLAYNYNFKNFSIYGQFPFLNLGLRYKI